MAKVIIPKQIEERSEKIDVYLTYLKRAKLLEKISIFLFVIFFGFVILYIEKVSILYILFIFVPFIFLIISIRMSSKTIPEKEILSLGLYKVVRGIMKKNLKTKYLKLIKDNLYFYDRKNIIKEGNIFESEKLKENDFLKNISEIIEKIYYAKNNGFLGKIKLDKIKEIILNSHYGEERNLLVLSNEINKIEMKDFEKEKFPTNFSKIRSLLMTKWGKFFGLELILFILISILEKAKFINFNEAKLFFVMITVGIIYVVFTEKK